MESMIAKVSLGRNSPNYMMLHLVEQIKIKIGIMVTKNKQSS